MDINKVWLTGLAISDPIQTKLNSRTPATTFLLQCMERFESKSGRVNHHPNVILIESLGSHAGIVMDRVRKGMRYQIEGYLRVDQGQGQRVCVRTFSVTKEPDESNRMFADGLRTALEAMRLSKDKSSAIDEVHKILAEIECEE